MGVPPKSFIFIGFPVINHPFWGTLILGNLPVVALHHKRLRLRRCGARFSRGHGSSGGGGEENSKGQSCAYLRNTQWIGLRENLQESPIFNGKIYGFL